MYLSWSDTSSRIIPDGGETSDSPEPGRVLAPGRCSGECQRLRSDIYISLRVWDSTATQTFP